jgi:hypothetical protein
MRPIDWPWAVLLCRYSDVATETRPPDYYQDLFTRNGTGGVVDYWRQVTYGGLDLTGSRVFGWMPMSHSTAEIGGLIFPGGRSTLAQWGRAAAAAAGIDLTPYRSVLIIQNFGPDHGAIGLLTDVVVVHTNPALCEFGFICHEMGHGFGLPHSFAANPDFGYGDGWDLMSFATTTFQFPVTFRDSSGSATVGLNARNLTKLGVLESSRRWSPPGPDFSATLVLDPLNQPTVGNHGPLVVEFPPSATRPARPDASTWTVELHQKAGWDQGIWEDAVTIHQIRTDGVSYLQPAIWSRFVAGQQFTLPAPEIHVNVTAIAANPTTATLRVWDMPEGCLRKEDSKPKVYLIQGGAKRWVTSPAVLFGLGKNWGDVRVIPDGSLTSVPDGPDVSLMTASVTPRPVPGNRAVQVKFTATDAGSGAPVAGRVRADGTDIGATNTTFTYTFRPRRVRIPGPPPAEFELIYPTVVVSAPGYPDVTVDCDFPDV